jgi:hypothetical protein
MKRWIVWLTLGTWAIVFVMIAVRYVNTGRMSDTSMFLVSVGVGSLLALASHVPRRRVLRWLLRSGAAAAIAVATYAFFRGAR